MNEQTAIRLLAEGFRKFSPSIRISAVNDLYSTICQAVAKDPFSAYYLHSYSASCVSGSYEVKPLYIHKDTDRSDIRIISSFSECLDMICQYVGKYRNNLIAVVKGGLVLKDINKVFIEKHGSFYPNLTHIHWECYHDYKTFSVYEFTFTYRIGKVKLQMMEQETNDEVARICRMLFAPGTPPEAKILLAHNYLASTVDYVKNNTNRLEESYTQSAYGALIKKKCVCQGYAEAFKRLMDHAGILCTVIYGNVMGHTTLHAWNLVSLDQGKTWYHLDVTWDDDGNRPSYTYFCKNDAFFKNKRTWNKIYNPKCNASAPILAKAKAYVAQNKASLLAKGIDRKVLDC